jgi:hypothetical protein
MPSRAFLAFAAGLSEIADLKNAVGPSLAADRSVSLRFARVSGRAQVVLLSAHFERYFYSVNEEAVEFVNTQNIPAKALPENLRLLHSRYPVDEMAGTSWERRSGQLAAFMMADGWLWAADINGSLSHERLLAWLRAPKPADLQRYYKYWSIDDIFARITRTPSSRSKLWLGVQELVDIRIILHMETFHRSRRNWMSNAMRVLRRFSVSVQTNSCRGHSLDLLRPGYRGKSTNLQG